MGPKSWEITIIDVRDEKAMGIRHLAAALIQNKPNTEHLLYN